METSVIAPIEHAESGSIGMPEHQLADIDTPSNTGEHAKQQCGHHIVARATLAAPLPGKSRQAIEKWCCR